MAAYYELPGLEQIYLEDSFVLGVAILPGSVRVQLDVVLREGHPSYVAPVDNEQYCFRKGALTLEEVSEVTWYMPPGPPAIDASGDTDYGGVDSYEVEGSVHRITGEIGELTVTCGRYSLHLGEGR
ncbi:MAG: hypothetical protein ACK5O2_13010 [Microthrixaceae bacterium]